MIVILVRITQGCLLILSKFLENKSFLYKDYIDSVIYSDLFGVIESTLFQTHLNIFLCLDEIVWEFI